MRERRHTWISLSLTKVTLMGEHSDVVYVPPSAIDWPLTVMETEEFAENDSEKNELIL